MPVPPPLSSALCSLHGALGTEVPEWRVEGGDFKALRQARGPGNSTCKASDKFRGNLSSDQLPAWGITGLGRALLGDIKRQSRQKQPREPCDVTQKALALLIGLP
ncbi:hypothetical protein M407DRAFT_8737 [Tulasnella calospora MUT 4182]|uniref:Uncharacterized protein n=1 Tax=Tulasnella calospora MUT 4182 TaxID=1051891 RepID=A0A0C3QFH5_9AGAM|nr:hypothetical protein M407DRAFT_8737 [Tulasnella calospora MUT 4182]